MDELSPEHLSGIFRFVRVGGLLTSLLVLTVAWSALEVLGGAQRRLGLRYAEHRLLIQRLGTLLRFVLYFGTGGLCIVLSFQLTDEMWLALGGTFAVAIGFALKDLLASVIAGITILLDKPFHVGDRVTFGEHYGEIVAIGLRSVQLKTLADVLVTIPNNMFLTEAVACSNAGQLQMLVELDFYIGTDQDFRKARQIVREAISSSRYAFLQKPWSVQVNSVIVEGYPAIRLRGRVYVADVQHELELQSDITEQVLGGFLEALVLPPASLYRSADPLPGDASGAQGGKGFL